MSWSKKWKSSRQPRKQRKYISKAPLHVRKNFISANLSKSLRQRHKKRSIPLRKGDKVKVLRGNFRKHTGAVTKVMLKKGRVFVEGVENIKKDGTKVFYPMHPSNLQIIDLILDDKKRKKILERK